MCFSKGKLSVFFFVDADTIRYAMPQCEMHTDWKGQMGPKVWRNFRLALHFSSVYFYIDFANLIKKELHFVLCYNLIIASSSAFVCFSNTCYYSSVLIQLPNYLQISMILSDSVHISFFFSLSLSPSPSNRFTVITLYMAPLKVCLMLQLW